ncbi:MAG: hypothetical protein ACD_81C00042G0003 [uncultured bacterium]|uniref:DUF998 domain-containing protein n=1 Tax=Candidatus Wolfebacteria bacterium GW2011_GWE2_44_13 TaxID=1619017 RepID=A0A0G1HAY1_9BACT|nr:MAG: hypothetical protein ACD_81C00042G0003 [uncultured bacterium]KKT43945.1 MAG: hypothetical protein UW32_C0001G0537 [Candidatus Wolfebacteria bacterium GW2011_GWE2_44_13]
MTGKSTTQIIQNKLGFYASVSTVVLTVVTFVVAILTPPLSGPFCRNNCFTYPFLDIVSRFPRDYIWMYPAILLLLVYVTLSVCIHYLASDEKKIYSHIGFSFALISATLLIADYFLQLSVIQPSLLNRETDGISILTQYNPHGIFIALEDLGYLLMSLSFLFMALVFSGSRLEKSIRAVFVTGFVLASTSLMLISSLYGIHREYRFEIAIIAINWLVLIISGILLSRLFKRKIEH